MRAPALGVRQAAVQANWDTCRARLVSQTAHRKSRSVARWGRGRGGGARVARIRLAPTRVHRNHILNGDGGLRRERRTLLCWAEQYDITAQALQIGQAEPTVWPLLTRWL